MKKNICLLLLAMLFLLIGCQSKISPDNYNKNKQKEITKVTDGKIKPDSKIAVQFYEKQIRKEDIGKYVDSDVFIFAPKISGKAFWKDEKTIVFQPDKPLNKKIKYGGILNLKNLFKFETKPERVPLTFESSGNEIVSSFFWFEPENKNSDSSMYIFTGYIEFSQSQTIEDVEKSLKLSSGFFSSVKLSVSKKNDKFFIIKSRDITRSHFGKNYKFKIKKKKLFYFKFIIFSNLRS